MCKELVLLHISRNTRSNRSLCGHAPNKESPTATYIRPSMINNRRGAKRCLFDEDDSIYEGIKRLYETDTLLTTTDHHRIKPNLMSSLAILAGAKAQSTGL